MTGTGRRLLGAALDTLRDEAPAHHALLRRALAELRVNIVLGDETFAPRLVGDLLDAGDPTGPAHVTVITSLAAVLGLLDARCTVIEAVTRGSLDLRGAADALDAAGDAFSIGLHGLVRAPSSPRLLDELRRHVEQLDQEIDHGQEQGPGPACGQDRDAQDRSCGQARRQGQARSGRQGRRAGEQRGRARP